MSLGESDGASPFKQNRRRRRVPRLVSQVRHAGAAILCGGAVVFAFGVLAADDYGLATDHELQYELGR